MISEHEARERALAMLIALGIPYGRVRRVIRIRVDAAEQARLRAIGVEMPIQDAWSVVVGPPSGDEERLPDERAIAVDAATGRITVPRSL